MKSKNPKKRSYYVNKVLDFTLIDSINSELFRTPSVLGYSLWFHEKIRIIRSQNDNKAYKKAFSTTSSEDFKNDKLFLLYMNVAKDMISGTLDRECIPRIPQTESHKRLYEKYPEIIDSRPKDEGYLLTDAELSRESALEAELSSKPLEYRRKFESWKGRSEFDRPIMEAHAIQRMEKDAVAPSMEKSAIPFLDDFSSEMATLERIESEWFETQVDIVQVLKFPLFADMGSPLVQSFHTKLDIAKSLSKKTLGNDFITAVSKAKMAWNTLCYEAERIELSKFDKGERKKILMATNLMNIALNAASTPSERQSAYRKAMEQLKGLVVIPKSATRAIEEIVSRKELTAL